MLIGLIRANSERNVGEERSRSRSRLRLRLRTIKVPSLRKVSYVSLSLCLLAALPSTVLVAALEVIESLGDEVDASVSFSSNF